MQNPGDEHSIEHPRSQMFDRLLRLQQDFVIVVSDDQTVDVALFDQLLSALDEVASE